MNSRHNYGIDSQKRDLIQLLSLMREQKYGCESTEIISEGMIMHMLKLLKSVKQIENPYSIHSLELLYQEFSKQMGKILFSVDELIAEGWIVVCVEQWSLNVGKHSDYEVVTSFSSQKEEQIFRFLKYLSNIPYIDEIEFEVSKEQSQEGLTKMKDDKIIICTEGDEWRKYGDIALAYWWDELVEGNADTTMWFYCWEHLYFCWTPDRYMKCVDEFYEVCLKLLENEKNKWTWDIIEKILRRKIYVENENARKKAFDKIIEFPRNRVEWKQQYRHMTDTFWYLSSPYQVIERVYCVCIRQYQNMEYSLRKRFIKCINIPFMSVVNMFWNDEKEVLVDCLEEPETFLFGAEKIWNITKEFISKNIYLEENISKKINACIFEILENHLEWAVYKEKWQDVLSQVTFYIFSESFYGNKSKTRNLSYMGRVCEDYQKWYKDTVIPMKKENSFLLNYLQEEFGKSCGMTATKYFKIFIAIAGLQQSEMHQVSENILKIYCDFVSRIPLEDMLVSQIAWEFWQNDAWYRMFRSLEDSENMLKQFLDALPLVRYKKEVDDLDGKSPILSIGDMALIHLYMIGNLFLSLKDELSPKKKELIETFFLDYFWGIQNERCNPFDVESIRLLESELVVKRCFESVELFDKKYEQVFVEKLIKESPEKLSLFMRYIKRKSVRRKICERLSGDTVENFTKNIYFIPTQQKLINSMIEICFENQTDNNLISTTEAVFEEFKQIIHNKGKRLETEYEQWMLAVQCQLDILNGQEEKVLGSGSLFYKAYIYLNHDDMDSLKNAEKIFGELFEENKNEGAYINQYCACVRICTCLECSEIEKKEYLEKAKMIETDIEERCALNIEQRRILFKNRFFLYMSLNDMPEILKTYAKMPDDLKYEYTCAQYIVKMFAEAGDMESAQKHITLLAERYGENEEISQLRSEIAEIGSKKIKIERPNDVVNSIYSIEALKNSLLRIRMLQDNECADLRIKSEHEGHLLYMVLDVAILMEQYSSLLKYEGNIASENSYNKLFQILFNQKNKEIYDFYAMDQTQEGTATGRIKNGRESVGSLDNAIYHGERIVSIVEGVILKACTKEKSNNI